MFKNKIILYYVSHMPSLTDIDYRYKYLKYKQKYSEAQRNTARYKQNCGTGYIAKYKQTGGTGYTSKYKQTGGSDIIIKAFEHEHSDHTVGLFTIYGRDYKFINYGKDLTEEFSDGQFKDKDNRFITIPPEIKRTTLELNANIDKRKNIDEIKYENYIAKQEFILIKFLYDKTLKSFISHLENKEDMTGDMTGDMKKSVDNYYISHDKKIKRLASLPIPESIDDYADYKAIREKIATIIIYVDNVTKTFVDDHIPKNNEAIKNKIGEKFVSLYAMYYKKLYESKYELFEILYKYLEIIAPNNPDNPDSLGKCQMEKLIRNRFKYFKVVFDNYIADNKIKYGEPALGKYFSLFFNIMINRQRMMGFNVPDEIMKRVKEVKELETKDAYTLPNGAPKYNINNIIAMEVPSYYKGNTIEIGTGKEGMAIANNMMYNNNNEYASSQINMGDKGFINMAVYHAQSKPGKDGIDKMFDVIYNLISKSEKFFIFLDTNVTKFKAPTLATGYERGALWFVDYIYKKLTADKRADVKFFIGKNRIDKKRPLFAFLNEQIEKIDLTVECDGIVFVTNIPETEAVPREKPDEEGARIIDVIEVKPTEIEQTNMLDIQEADRRRTEEAEEKTSVK